MTRLWSHVPTRLLAGAACLIVIAMGGCSNDNVNGPQQSTSLGGVARALDKKGIPGAGQVNLVSDVSGFSAKRTDMNLQNAWGIATTPNGLFWISANHSGLAVVYDKDGNSIRTPVSIPTSGSTTGGAPSGALFNPTTAFAVPGTGTPARFIFAGEDGVISAWSSGSSAVVVVDRSSMKDVYKGITMASVGHSHILIATNFRGGTVEVFDEAFNFVTDTLFRDREIPAGFAPFNAGNIRGKIFITFAKQKPPDNMDDQSGPGFGYVDIFTSKGKLIRRFASQGPLNSPWGLAEAGVGEGSFGHSILVGNFGDGRINAFSEGGNFLGPVKDDKGSPITIDGLWAITSVGGESDGDRHSGRLYFTAGPNDENDGLFGFLQFGKSEKEKK